MPGIVGITDSGECILGTWGQDSAELFNEVKRHVNFGEDTISGDLQLPDGEYIESRKRLRHSNLIRIRDNFRDKILRSISSM